MISLWLIAKPPPDRVSRHTTCCQRKAIARQAAAERRRLQGPGPSPPLQRMVQHGTLFQSSLKAFVI
jgi:hypothetical protein